MSGARLAAEVAGVISDTTLRTLAVTQEIATRMHGDGARIIDLLLRTHSQLDGAALAEANVLGANMRGDIRGLIDTAVQDEVIVRRWRRHRIVYAVHHDLADALIATDPDSRVPCGDLLRMLPHPDPFVAFPRPISMRAAGTDEEVRYVGFYVYGMNAHDQGVSTAAPSARRLSLMCIGVVYGQDGEPRRSPRGILDLVYARMSLPAEAMPHRDVVLDVFRRFTVRDRDASDTPSADVSVPALLQVALPVLIYLCAQNADRELAAPKEVTRRRGRRAAPGRLPTVVKLGFRLGPKLNAARRAAEASGGDGTGRRMRPHVRRAHWHTFRAGKGRQDTVLHWLPPIPVHPEEEAEVATVVPVD